MFSKPKRIYLDYASITPVDSQVISVLSSSYKEYSANPSSLYKEGVTAYEKLEESRKIVAQLLEVHSDEIYFTSGGTEGDNLAIVGPIKAFIKQNKGLKPHVVSTVIEHPAILSLLEHLSEMGVCDVSLVPVEEDGRVSPKSIKEALRPETVVVSVMYVNNEIGTIQPIQEIAKTLRHYKKESGRTNFSYPYLHTDACQAAQYLSLRVPELGIDLMTLDGSKIYGPRGCGAVYIRRGIPVESLLYGGDQERGVRPGTESVAQIAGFTEALQLCRKEYTEGVEAKRIGALRDSLFEYIQTELQKHNVVIKENGDRKIKVPNNINICIEGIDAEFAVLKLDAEGIAISSVTSCRSKKDDSTSYVIEALERANGIVYENTKRVGEFVGCSKSSLRITLGRYTTVKEVERAKKIFVSVLTKIVGYQR